MLYAQAVVWQSHVWTKKAQVSDILGVDILAGLLFARETGGGNAAKLTKRHPRRPDVKVNSHILNTSGSRYVLERKRAHGTAEQLVANTAEVCRVMPPSPRSV